VSVPTRPVAARLRSPASATRGDARVPTSERPLRRFERSLLRSESGQTLVEYSLILVLVALVCFAALGVIGGTVKDFLQSMAMQV
jgi:Flp pilus assembly pilin Flp